MYALRVVHLLRSGCQQAYVEIAGLDQPHVFNDLTKILRVFLVILKEDHIILHSRDSRNLNCLYYGRGVGGGDYGINIYMVM